MIDCQEIAHKKHAETERIIDVAAEYKKNAATGQMDLFGNAINSGTGDDSGYIYQPLPDWTDKEKLEKEKEVVGFYLSSHPLDAYKTLFKMAKHSII